MKKILKSKTNILAGIILAVYIISLIPILYVSFFNHPTADDYGFSSLVHNTYINGGNILEIIGSSIQQIINFYFSWQGTFSAIFIFSLQPGVFSQDLYFATTFIMIIALTCSTIFFFDTVIVKWLKSKKSYMIIISILLLTLSIQFIPDKNQAFYWFNGSAYYTLFYSFALVLFSVTIRIILSVKKGLRLFYA
ncbi:MAG: hypothetical protein LUF33_08585 [Clostridiales bacterium]|nr:hypothetical protein [Clostridiales bacterium]